MTTTFDGLNEDFRGKLAFHGAPRASGDFDEAWASRVEAQVDGRTVHVIGRDALVKSKTAAARPRDLADVARLGRKPPR
jgi:hypothetical protein